MSGPLLTNPWLRDVSWGCVSDQAALWWLLSNKKACGRGQLVVAVASQPEAGPSLGSATLVAGGWCRARRPQMRPVCVLPWLVQSTDLAAVLAGSLLKEEQQ